MEFCVSMISYNTKHIALYCMLKLIVWRDGACLWRVRVADLYYTKEGRHPVWQDIGQGESFQILKFWGQLALTRYTHLIGISAHIYQLVKSTRTDLDSPTTSKDYLILWNPNTKFLWKFLFWWKYYSLIQLFIFAPFFSGHTLFFFHPSHQFDIIISILALTL